MTQLLTMTTTYKFPLQAEPSVLDAGPSVLDQGASNVFNVEPENTGSLNAPLQYHLEPSNAVVLDYPVYSAGTEFVLPDQPAR